MTVGLSRDLVEQIVRISVAAGDEIMKIYNSGFTVESKDDRSPVTAADRAAEDLITRAILQTTDAFPIVGEEAVSEGRIPDVAGTPFWLVDPLDGTKEFINHRDEFTVNIALVDERRPVLGVVHVPAKGETYVGSPFGAFVRRGKGEPRAIACRPTPEKGLIAVASRSHRSPAVDDYLARFDIAESISAGSSIKFCLVAEGKADLYPRFGRTMEWDTAAGHAVLRHAGGEVVLVDGSEFRYAKPGFENPDFIARSRPA